MEPPECCDRKYIELDVVENESRKWDVRTCTKCGRVWERDVFRAGEHVDDSYREIKGPDKRLVTFPVMVAGELDDEMCVYSEDVVRKAAANPPDVPGMSVVESRVITGPERIGDTDVAPNTWIMTCRVDDDDLWRRIKSGELDRVSVDWDPRERIMRGYQPKGHGDPAKGKPPKSGSGVQPPPGWAPNLEGSGIVPPDWSPKTSSRTFWKPARRTIDGSRAHVRCLCGRLHEVGLGRTCDCGAELWPVDGKEGFMIVDETKLGQESLDKLSDFFERGKGKAPNRIPVIEATGSGTSELGKMRSGLDKIHCDCGSVISTAGTGNAILECACGERYEKSGERWAPNPGGSGIVPPDSYGKPRLAAVAPLVKAAQKAEQASQEYWQASKLEQPLPCGTLLVGSGKPEFVSTPRADLRTVIDAMDCAVKKAAESRPVKLTVKVPASTGPTSEPRTLETFEDFVDVYGGNFRPEPEPRLYAKEMRALAEATWAMNHPKPAPTRSRHQARLERRYSKRPLSSDKPEKRRRRWFWPAVLVLLTVISGVAGALTIYDRWPESVPKHQLADVAVRPHLELIQRFTPPESP